MSESTAGPWKFDDRYLWVERTVRPPKEHYRVVGPNPSSEMGWTPIALCCSNAKATDNKANAHLIAAAPDLLEAAKTVVEILRDKGVAGWGVSKDILNAAIAKAEGRS